MNAVAAPARRAPLALRIPVALLLLAALGLSLAQQAHTVGPWWLELSRYLPYPVLLAPGVLALLLSAWLGWRWRAASVGVLLVTLWFGLGFVWGRADAGELPVRFVTYNIKAYKAVVRPGGYTALTDEVRRLHPDILVAQDNDGPSAAQPVADWAGGRAFGLPFTYAAGQYVIASRYPLRECVVGDPDQRGQPRSHVRCTVDIDGIALTVVTSHFQSPRSGLNAARRDGLDGADEWRDNYDDRLEQSRLLAARLRVLPRPLIVAGDLNAPESSAVVRALLKTGLRDAYSSAGRGYGYSYGQALKVGFSFLRIDHVLVSTDIGVAACAVGDGAPSDHRPVVADLLLLRR